MSGVGFDMFRMFSGIGESVTVNGTTTTGILNTVSADPKYVDAGIEQGISFLLTVKLSEFLADPAVGQKATISSKIYRIISTEKDPKGLTMTLALGEEYA